LKWLEFKEQIFFHIMISCLCWCWSFR